ncbi:MAG: hypothetical protein QME51_08820, partial [Planctomycetota bacterium]|nr:hypothetical protein [Planctomycetota bacterium]
APVSIQEQVSPEVMEQEQQVSRLLQDAERFKSDNPDLELSDQEAFRAAGLLREQNKKTRMFEAIKRRRSSQEKQYKEQREHEKATGRPWWQDVILALGLGPQRYLGHLLQAGERERAMAEEARMGERRFEQAQQLQEQKAMWESALAEPKELTPTQQLAHVKLGEIKGLTPEQRQMWATGQWATQEDRDKVKRQLELKKAEVQFRLPQVFENPVEFEKNKQEYLKAIQGEIDKLGGKKPRLRVGGISPAPEVGSVSSGEDDEKAIMRNALIELGWRPEDITEDVISDALKR